MNDETKRARANYRPGGLGEARVETAGDRHTLVFVRELRHAPERVWRALTAPAELSAWAPFDVDRDLSTTGLATLIMVGGAERLVSPCAVRIARPPRLLEYTWETDVLRWELEPSPTGTRLTLRHTLGDRSFVPKIAAGWHLCLDVAERALDGAPVGRIVAKDALEFGWERLNDEYAKRFGIENTGVPADVDGR